MTDLQHVQMIDLPVKTWRRTAKHQEALRRELDIIRAGESEHAVPNRLFALIEEYTGRYGGLNDEVDGQLFAASARGAEAITVTYLVPESAAEAADRLGAMLDEVDEYCRAGEHLMSLATPPDLVAFRRWFLGEFRRQLSGDPPLPWPQYPAAGRSARPETLPRAASESDAGTQRRQQSTWGVQREGTVATIAVGTDLDLATAPSLRDLIQELIREGVAELTIDLTDGVFLDSLAVSLFMTTHDRLVQNGGRLRLIVGPRLLSVLETAEVTGSLEIEVADR